MNPSGSLNVGFINQPLEETLNGLAQFAHHPIVLLFRVAQLLSFGFLAWRIECNLLFIEASLEERVKIGFIADERTVR